MINSTKGFLPRSWWRRRGAVRGRRGKGWSSSALYTIYFTKPTYTKWQLTYHSHSTKGTYRDLGEDVEEQGEAGEVEVDPLAAEALPEVLGHGEHLGRHVHGKEQPAQQQQEVDGLLA